MKTKRLKKYLSIILAAALVATGILISTAVSASVVDFETQMAMEGFPESYKVLLRQLHEAHPDWKFEALRTGITLEAAAVGEQGRDCNKNFVYKTSDTSMRCTCANCYKNGAYISKESGIWYGASAGTISYYLDPRNFMDEQYIFQFLNLSYDGNSQNEAGVEKILSGSYMAGAKANYLDVSGVLQNSDQTYAQLIMEAAKQSGASAYYLASKIRQEIGAVPSTSTSGTNAVYPGIYNFYNIGAYTGAVDGLKWASASAASGEGSVTANTGLNLRTSPSVQAQVIRVIPNGAKVQILSEQGDWYQISYGGNTGYVSATYIAKGSMSYGRPWTSPEKSIINGAKWIADNYINKGQNTGYLQKFNVNPDSSYQMFDHQYMTNVQGAASEGASTYRAYKNMGMLDTQLTFLIPVFDNMPNDPGVSLTITDTSVTGLEPGSTYQIYAYPYPTDLTVNWSVADSSVAVVDGNGLVTAVGAGSTLLTATAGGISKTCAIQVVGSETVPAISVTVSPSAHTLTVGGTASLSASVYPVNTTDSVQWRSTNPQVAYVDGNGNVVAVGVGEVDIIAASSSGVWGACHIYVNQRQIDAEYLTGNLGRTGTVRDVSSTLNVRSGPGIGYGVVTRIGNNIGVVVHYNSGDWYNITANGNTGFVHKDYIKLNVQWQMQVGDEAWFGVTMHPGDATSKITYTSSNPAVATVAENAVITAKGAGEVVITATSSNGKTCDMVIKVTGASPVPPSGGTGSTATVTATSLNMRTGPGTSYSRIATLSKGTAVTILGSSGSWYYINANGRTGYVSGAYLAVNGGTSSRSGTVNASALNVRTGPGAGYGVSVVIPRGTTVTIHSATGEWYRITFSRNGSSYEGYVSAQYIS